MSRDAAYYVIAHFHFRLGLYGSIIVSLLVTTTVLCIRICNFNALLYIAFLNKSTERSWCNFSKT